MLLGHRRRRRKVTVYLRGVHDIHNDSALQHLREPGLDLEVGRGIAIGESFLIGGVVTHGRALVSQSRPE